MSYPLSPAPPPEPPPPPRHDDADELVAQFFENGGFLQMEIEGDGTYTLMRGRSTKGFPLKVYWAGRGYAGSAINRSGYGHPNYGGELIFSPHNWGHSKTEWTEEQMVRLIIGVLQAGRELSQMECGYQINSGDGYRAGWLGLYHV